MLIEEEIETILFEAQRTHTYNSLEMLFLEEFFNKIRYTKIPEFVNHGLKWTTGYEGDYGRGYKKTLKKEIKESIKRLKVYG